MRNFTDSLFEDLVTTEIKSISDVPGAAMLVKNVVSCISSILYDNSDQLHIIPKEDQISNNSWEYILTFNSYSGLTAFEKFLNNTNKYLTNFYNKVANSKITPKKDSQIDANGFYTQWQIANNASDKAKLQFNVVANFISKQKEYLKNLLSKVENKDKVQVDFSTTTPSIYNKDNFNLKITIKIDLASFEKPIDICQDLNTDSTKEILGYFINHQDKYFSTSGMLNYINKYVQNKYGNYFKNGISVFQYLINALNQETDLVIANPNKIIPFKPNTLGKLLPKKLVTADPDLKLILNNNSTLTADAKIYGKNADSRFMTNHISDYLLAVKLGVYSYWTVYSKKDNYQKENNPTYIPLFKENNLVFPNLILVKFKTEDDLLIEADKVTDDQLPKFIKVSITYLSIQTKCARIENSIKVS